MKMHRKYALIGKRLEHSFSKNYFTRKFEKKEIDASYENYELNDLDHLKQLFSEKKIQGFNITNPFKEKIIPLLDSLDENSKQIGAVNCVEINKEKWIGHNTDVIGFEKSLKKFIKHQKPKALIFGTGGASKAAQYVLTKMKLKYTIVSRNDYWGTIHYNDLDQSILESHRLLINTTPVGMYPNVERCLDIPFNFINQKHFCFDLIYNPAKTKFLERAQDTGAQILNGIEMLEIQAEESWIIWNS